MERHANYALVGILTTLLVMGALIFAVWLGGTDIGRSRDDYQVLFQGPVSGLSEGGEVQFNGIKVGEIERVRLAPQDSSKILVDIRVRSDTPVREDSVASTSTQALSGVSAILISAGTPSRPLLKQVSDRHPPLIPSRPSRLSSMLSGGSQLIEGANEAIGRVNRLLSDRNIAQLGAVVADLRATTGELATNRAMFDRASSAIAKIDRSMDDVQATAAEVRGLVRTDGQRTLRNAADAMEELKQAVEEARSAIAAIDSAAGAVQSETLPSVTDSLQSLGDAADELNDLIRQIRQDPRGALGRGSSSERKLDP